MRQIILLILSALLLQDKILATTVQYPTWEHLATTSEFIGIVECVTAGGIVARYRVIDSWKGAAVDTEMNIGQHADVFGPQFPISLVGERFFVFADNAIYFRISSFTSGGGVPLWWRKIPADLRCFQLMPINEPIGEYLFSYFRTRSSGLAQFKSDVTEFLGYGKQEQEMRLMLASARKSLHLQDHTVPSANGNEEDKQLFDSLQGTMSVEELWKRIITHAAGFVVPAVPESADQARNRSHKLVLLLMLSEGGREQCKDLLEKADHTKLPWDRREIEQVISEIGRNLYFRDQKHNGLTDPYANSRKPQTPADITKAKELLSKSWDYQTGAAFELLCRHAPDSVVPYLLGCEPSQGSGYLLGSAFGHLCSADRSKHLKALQSANDDWVRTSAAVYLCFDDLNEGKAALRKMTMSEGDVGAWAALVLASRGDKSVMLRALEVLATPEDFVGTPAIHGNLQKRLRVLLSNAANASGVVQPPYSPEKYPAPDESVEIQKKRHEMLILWWQENQEKIILADPWAKILVEQRVD